MKPVVVVGAGLSGLVRAHALKRKGVPVKLLEATDHLGGVIRTERKQGFQLDCGANTFVDRLPELKALLAELGLAEQVLRAPEVAKRRYLAHRGRLELLPA